MKFFKVSKDGGSESHVTGLFFVEIKKLFSFALLHFSPGSRDAFHTHAFHAVSWLLKGRLSEEIRDGEVKIYKPSLIPIITKRNTNHKVSSEGDSYAFTFRGPWVDKWTEYLPKTNESLTLTHGRKVL